MCHPPVWAGLILCWSGTELPPTCQIFPKLSLSLPLPLIPFCPLFGVGREASYLGVRPRPLSMAHDYLFMPLLPLLEGLGTFSWAWIPRASLLVVILHRAWEPEAASEVL